MGYRGDMKLIQQWTDVMCTPRVTERPPPTGWGLWKRIHSHPFCVVPVMRGYGQLRASGR